MQSELDPNVIQAHQREVQELHDQAAADRVLFEKFQREQKAVDACVASGKLQSMVLLLMKAKKYDEVISLAQRAANLLHESQ